MSLAVSLTTASAADREGTDYYPTPADVTHALLDYLSLPAGTRVWEPACGEGHMAEVLKERGLKTHVTDLHDRGYGRGGVDFLATPAPVIVEWIITNPPFSLAEAFIRHALSLELPFALLLKGQFWHAARRRTLFEEHRPSHVLPLTWRPDFLMGRKGGSPTMEAAWTVWGASPAQSTVFAPLVRPISAALAAAPQQGGEG
ncbi:SAM-dependent DNA methyltransferase [Deinococcus ruber]|uniref:SAM-dependent methyltransferase n=1 Tax=Deinococcus ruber TaxID=1848197 RepID=A0A918CMF1_9DEIO|nr:SAM-dependent DNA methyltransferase [Deinococcus ruber]GGR31300.1 hypothetical protein GCM10008957_47470 [Deinococcus ruber]